MMVIETPYFSGFSSSLNQKLQKTPQQPIVDTNLGNLFQ